MNKESTEPHAYPDVVNEDGSITDALGTPCGYSTRSTMRSRYDDEEDFAFAMSMRVHGYEKANELRAAVMKGDAL